MEKTVYIDLLFLINFSMDFLCFYISSRILSVKLRLFRIGIASALGGIYSGAVLFWSLGGAMSLLIDLSVCFIMCLIVYAGKGSDILLSFLLYLAVSMALGGFMTAIFNLLREAGFGEGVSVEEEGISVWLFALIALLSGFFTLLGGRFFKKRSSVRRAEVKILWEGRQAKLSALIDSGNLLREPISGRSCVVVDASALAGFLPEEILCASSSGVLSGLSCVSARYAKSIGIIPTATATGEGLLLSVRADRIEIDAGRGYYEADAVIALGRLGEGEASALVPAELIK